MHAQAATNATMDASSPEMTVTDFEWLLDIIRTILAMGAATDLSQPIAHKAYARFLKGPMTVELRPYLPELQHGMLQNLWEQFDSDDWKAAVVLGFFDLMRPTLKPVGLARAPPPPPTTTTTTAMLACAPPPPPTLATTPIIASSSTKSGGGHPFDNDLLYCWCREPANDNMTGCDGCDKWFHWSCIKEKMGEKAMHAAMQEGRSEWYCANCM